MIPDEFRQIIPLPQPEIEATFAAYQATRQFYQEVKKREDLAHYCDWYHETAQRHQQELQQMRGELNIMSWFRRGRH